MKKARLGNNSGSDWRTMHKSYLSISEWKLRRILYGETSQNFETDLFCICRKQDCHSSCKGEENGDLINF